MSQPNSTSEPSATPQPSAAPQPSATPQPSAKSDPPQLTCRTDISEVKRLADNTQRVTTMLTLKAPTLKKVEDRKSTLRITVAVDVSGSMSGGRLELAKETLKFIIGELGATDELGIVAYDTDVYLRLPLTRMDSDGKGRASAVTSDLRTGSSTNLSGGLFGAIELVLGREVSNVKQVEVRRSVMSTITSAVASLMPRKAEPSPVDSSATVICATLLLTDGQANVGLTDAPSIVTAMTEKYLNRERAAVHTFGFGSDHNADLLRAISEAAQGSYCFIEEESRIKEAFATCLGGLVSVVMQQIKVRASAVNGARIVRTLTKYPQREVEDGGVEVSIADLYSGEQRDTLVEVEVPARVEASGVTPLVKWTVQYDDSVSGAPKQRVTGESSVTFTDSPTSTTPDVVVDEQLRRLEVVQVIARARETANRGDIEAAKVTLQAMKKQLASAPSASSALVQGLATECEELSDALVSPAVWQQQGAKLSNMAEQRHAQQRSNAYDKADPYTTPFQVSMKSKAAKR